MKINYNLDKYECIIELQTSKMANRQLKEIANKALRGSLVVQWGLDEIPYINGRVEWNIQLSSVSNSIQVRLQSLSILLFLCDCRQ